MIALDGHDYFSSAEDTQEGKSFRITSMSPPAGTMVGRNDPITLHGTVLEAADVVSLPPATFPCSWLTANEVARAAGAPTVTASPTSDKAGEEDPFCAYTFDDSMVTSQLFSSVALAVDAGHMFAFYTASKPDEPFIDVDGFPGPARCVSTKVGSSATPSHAVWALLDGDRIYRLAAGLRDVPCVTLKALARKAVQRIGE